MKVEGTVFYYKDYGRVNVKLFDLLEKKDVSRYKLVKLTGVSFNTIDKYCHNESIGKLDMDIISRICYVLECGIEDILEYVREDVNA